MQKLSTFKDSPYLNRLALTTADNAGIPGPQLIIKDFFSFGSTAEMKDLFMESCRAALSEKYSWKEGSPGNLLYFYERLERLVEACYLICSSSKYANKMLKKISRAAKTKPMTSPNLPCSLSATEVNDPVSVLKLFFAFHTIKQWKQAMYAWLEAGLSKYTVLDNITAKDLLPYYYHFQKLIDACWCIYVLLKKIK